MPTLNTNVTVIDPENGEAKTVPAGTSQEDLDQDTLDLITNPDVWAEEEKDEGEKPEGEKPEPASNGDGQFGSGPFKSRSAAEVRALATLHGLDNENKDEAVAALEAAGISPDDEPPVPTSTDTNVEG